MLKISQILLFACVAIEVQANTFKPNAFLSRMITKLSGEPVSSRVVQEPYAELEQPVNHNNPSQGTFTQKFAIYDDWYLAGGPLFFLISARSDFYGYLLKNSIPTDVVEQTRGAIYALEPRYHNISRPTTDISTLNLQNYFTLDQIIRDNIEFIEFIVSHFNMYGPPKVILYGYDTGATLATWIYSLYPNKIDGVWASSAPMYPTAELSTYFSDVQTTIGNVNPNCHDRLELAFAEIDILITAEEGAQISKIFNIGNHLSTHDKNDVNLFFYALLSGIGSIVEYGNVELLAKFCDALENGTSESNVEPLGNYFKEFFDSELLTYANFVNHLKLDTWDSADVINGERQQLFQACSYFSWFRTSTEISSFFNVNLPFEFYTNLCNDVFGIQPEDIIAGNELTSTTYKLNANLTNIYFTNGMMDPFRQVGITSAVGTKASADLIMKVGKGNDFRQINDKLDSQEVLDVKFKVKHLLESWIK